MLNQSDALFAPRSALILGLLFAVPALSLGACGGDDDDAAGATTTTTGTGGDPCVGGVLVDGVCQAKCVPEKCLAENTCVNNACQLKCDSHADCALDGSQDCLDAVEDDTGAAIRTCQSNGKGAGVGLHCPFGVECADPAIYNLNACSDGTKCDPAGEACASGSCQGLACTGQGEADADAYCTTVDCSADADCPGGYFCAVARVCDATSPIEPCIDASAFADGGAGAMPGPGGQQLRNMCMKRPACAPCETDLDCSQFAGQRCADQGGVKVCAQTCGSDNDCFPGYACDATGVCLHKFGSCAGTGQFCEPCVNDLDCGPADGSSVCAVWDNGNGCFDYGFPDTCTSNADCPKSPSGKSGECLDENEGVSPGDSVYHRCYVPLNAASYKAGCW